MANAVAGHIKSGAAALDQLTGGNFVKFETGKPLDVVFLTGVDAPAGEIPVGNNCMIAFKQWQKWIDKEDLPEGVRSPMFVATNDPYDPGAILGLDSKFRALAIVQVVGEDDEKILAMGAGLFNQLVAIESTLGESIKGLQVRLKKTGEGMRTKYTATATAKRMVITGEPLTDLTDFTGPSDRNEVIKLLEAVNLWPPPGGDPMPAPGSAKKKARPVVSQTNTVTTTEEEDTDDAPFKTVDED